MSDNLIEILVDDRESKVIPSLKACKNPRGFKIVVRRLTVGDYAFYYKNILLICIERKSWRDLADSIVDGRKDNIQKMKNVQNKTGCNLVYIIEGNEYPISQNKIPKIRIPFKNLRSHLDHLALRDGVIIIRSKNYKDTADRLIDFAENFCTLHKNLDQFTQKGKSSGYENMELNSEADDEKIVTIPIAKNNDMINLAIWKSIAGVTDITYEILCKHDYDMKDFILGNIDIKELGSLKYCSGYSLGEKKAQKITSSAMTKKTWIKMMNKVPGVTKKTADGLLTTYKMMDIVTGKVNQNDLSSYKKTKQRKLGKVVAQRIIKHFQIDAKKE